MSGNGLHVRIRAALATSAGRRATLPARAISLISINANAFCQQPPPAHLSPGSISQHRTDGRVVFRQMTPKALLSSSTVTFRTSTLNDDVCRHTECSVSQAGSQTGAAVLDDGA